MTKNEKEIRSKGIELHKLVNWDPVISVIKRFAYSHSPWGYIKEKYEALKSSCRSLNPRRKRKVSVDGWILQGNKKLNDGLLNRRQAIGNRQQTLLCQCFNGLERWKIITRWCGYFKNIHCRKKIHCWITFFALTIYVPLVLTSQHDQC